MRRSFLVALSVCALAGLTASVASAKRVLLVGSYHGIKGQYKTLQSAVNAAKPGDWILIGPGDYKTTSSRSPDGRPDLKTAVLITKKNLTIRGMNRNTVIIDGTTKGAACNDKKANQNFGPNTSKGHTGLNGILVYKANNVSIENLTACNFLGGSGDAGNEIWWNGGDGSGTIGGWGYYGAYLNATSTYFDGETNAAQYGIFSSNWDGGTWNQTYASNFNDSGYYIGACQQSCNQTVNHAWGEYSALGYSGSNSGGKLIVENSQFDRNQDGFDTNSQNGDDPSPQNGACPNNGTSPITHTHSCWVFMHNNVHDNNNWQTPSAGSAAAGPVGTGMSVSGGRNDTIMDNTFANNGAWGVIFVSYPDNGPPCTGGVMGQLGPGSCLFDEWGDGLFNNTFKNDGYFGHPSNGDFQELRLLDNEPQNCFAGNKEAGGGSIGSDELTLEHTFPSCNGTLITASSSNVDSNFLNEVLCDSQVSLGSGPPTCPTGKYHPPVGTDVKMHKLPTKQLKTMANPCAGVPKNAWCSRKKA